MIKAKEDVNLMVDYLLYFRNKKELLSPTVDEERGRRKGSNYF